MWKENLFVKSKVTFQIFSLIFFYQKVYLGNDIELPGFLVAIYMAPGLIDRFPIETYMQHIPYGCTKQLC